jgi:hypothetical protein
MKGVYMGLFDSILEKLGLKKPVPAPVAPKPAAPKVQTDSRPIPPGVKPGVKPPTAPGLQGWGVTPGGQPSIPPKPAPMEMVDVKAKLDKLAKDKGEKLQWKVSIVDLLKVIGVDSSLAARKELAKELGCPEEKMHDKGNVNMNIWLHKEVLRKIAENGGNIPKELLD